MRLCQAYVLGDFFFGRLIFPNVYAAIFFFTRAFPLSTALEDFVDFALLFFAFDLTDLRTDVFLLDDL